MKTPTSTLLKATALALVLGSGVAWAGGQFTSQLPAAYQPFAGNETLPLDTNLGQGAQPQTVSATLANIAGYVKSTSGAGPVNALRGGDFSSNLFQRGASGSGITTASAYGADGWSMISGTSTSMQWSSQTGAGDITHGMNKALRIQRTSGQTGVVPVCVGQVLTSAESVRFQNHTAVFEFIAQFGANFTAASNQVTASIIYGTSADDTAANFWAGSWAGQTVGIATAQTLSSTYIASGATVPTVFSVAAAIPKTATQLGVKICFTPVGTASTNDWFEFGLAALVLNDNGTFVAFPYNSSTDEQVRQQRFFYRLTETAAITPVAPCAAIDTTHTNCLVQFPVTMRAVPTMAYANGFASPTSTSQATLGACTTLAAAATVTSTAANAQNALATCTATTIPAAGVASFLYGNGGTGTISASAEL